MLQETILSNLNLSGSVFIICYYVVKKSMKKKAR